MLLLGVTARVRPPRLDIELSGAGSETLVLLVQSEEPCEEIELSDADFDKIFVS